MQTVTASAPDKFLANIDASSLADDALRLIVNQRWYAGKSVAATSALVRDAASFAVSEAIQGVWLLLQVAPENHTYSVVLQNNGGEPSLLEANEFLAVMQRERTLLTQCGGRLEFTGPLHDTPAVFTQLGEGNSSNSVYRTRLDSIECAAKFYRQMNDSARCEAGTLEALKGSGIPPAIVAQLNYECQNEKQILALYTEYLEGRPAYQLFQPAARRLLAQLMADTELEAALQQPENLAENACRAIGRGVARFHSAAWTRDHTENRECDQTESARCELIATLPSKWHTVEQLLRSSTHVPQAEVDALIGDVSDLLQHTATLKQQAANNTYGHGDLHLSHLILQTGATQLCRVIDPAKSLLDDEFGGYAAQDLYQLYRGLEYFMFDEIITFLERSREWSRMFAAESLFSSDEIELWRLRETLQQWPQSVFQKITAAYINEATPELTSPLASQQWTALFYLDRILGEVTYNLQYDRPFFLLCDRFFLARFLTEQRQRFENDASSNSGNTMHTYV